MQFGQLKRRDFITLLGAAAVAVADCARASSSSAVAAGRKGSETHLVMSPKK
jgi:hypothetical protein